MRQPIQKDRTVFLVLCTIGCVVLLAGAAVRFTLEGPVNWDRAPIEAAAFVLSMFMLLAGAGLSGWLAIGLARGPSMSAHRYVSSEEWGYCFASAMAAALFVSLTLNGLMMLRNESYESYAVTVGAVVLFAPLAALFTFGVAIMLWRIIFRGRSRVVMPAAPVVAGTSFECGLEIPFAVDHAPEVRATLSLVRSNIESPLNDMSEIDTVCWSEAADSSPWQPIGARRSIATLRFETRGGVPADIGNDGTDYSWLLEVRSTDPKRAFVGRYLLPIAFRDPIAEGLLATG